MAAAEPEAVRAVESGGRHAEKTNLPLSCSVDEEQKKDPQRPHTAGQFTPIGLRYETRSGPCGFRARAKLFHRRGTGDRLHELSRGRMRCLRR